MQQQLAKEFTSLVDWSVTELGHVIRAELGTAAFNRIEHIRRQVKSPSSKNLQGLMKLKFQLEKISNQERFAIAHSFGLMLELINACESAYRTFRLEQEDTAPLSSDTHSYGRIIHVLTAHPTESRNTDIIHYLRKIHDLLVQRLNNSEDVQTKKLHALIRMAWHLPLSKQRKPSVMDEAEYIYSLILQDDILDIFIEQRQNRLPFYVRTWVGGDKDGHPGVNEKTLLGSLSMSRRILLKWVLKRLDLHLNDLQPLAHSGLQEKKALSGLLADSRKLKQQIKKLHQIAKGDDQRVQNWASRVHRLSHQHLNLLGAESEHLNAIRSLFKVFPALVVPLEIREDSSLVHEALKKPVTAMNISKMLKALDDISPDHNPRDYVRGFILSQCESAADIEAGVLLSQKVLGAARIPVVPLYESSHSLQNSHLITEEFLAKKKNLLTAQKLWSSQMEVMLGYSDSAKEIGSFASRFLIQSAMKDLEKAITKHNLTPIFFHGSGGSIERGGGSIQEQTEWWPLSALKNVKMTVQGEMVYRSYNSAPILQRQINLLVQNRSDRRNTPARQESSASHKLLRQMAEATQNSYQTILQEPSFLELIEKATPYSFMKDLRMGSRPSKRQGPVQIKSLRAIPWVLCWTQTRALFPTWWGVGSFWLGLDKKTQHKYRAVLKESAMFRSYIKALGFTLQKVELDMFFFYLHCSKLAPELRADYERRFKAEYRAALKCMKELTGENNLLWYRPWLKTSIGLRSPLIHPLNMLQLIALEKKDIKLLRETVTGVASGMLTTG